MSLIQCGFVGMCSNIATESPKANMQTLWFHLLEEENVNENKVRIVIKAIIIRSTWIHVSYILTTTGLIKLRFMARIECADFVIPSGYLYQHNILKKLTKWTISLKRAKWFVNLLICCWSGLALIFVYTSCAVPVGTAATFMQMTVNKLQPNNWPVTLLNHNML